MHQRHEQGADRQVLEACCPQEAVPDSPYFEKKMTTPSWKMSSIPHLGSMKTARLWGLDCTRVIPPECGRT